MDWTAFSAIGVVVLLILFTLFTVSLIVPCSNKMNLDDDDNDDG